MTTEALAVLRRMPRRRTTRAALTSPRVAIDHDAVRDMVPLVLGVVPFAVVVGVTMAELGVDLATGLLGSFALYGGSVQMATLALLGSGSGLLAVALTAAIVNARLLLYGALLAARFEGQPVWFRWFGPHLIVDQTYALAAARPELDDPARFRRYWLTATSVLTVGWLGGIATGMSLGPLVPADSPLEVTTAALFVGLLVPKLGDRVAALAAVVASLTAVITIGVLSLGAGLVVSIAAGVAVAAIVTREEA